MIFFFVCDIDMSLNLDARWLRVTVLGVAAVDFSGKTVAMAIVSIVLMILCSRMGRV